MSQLAHFDATQIDLIKRTICIGATDDELQLFLAQAQRLGLDPFTRQIHAVKRWNAAAGREVMITQVGIDGLRLIAERTGDHEGTEGPQWCGEDGQWHDVWLGPGHPVAARVTVYRRGRRVGTVGVAHWAEFAQSKSNGQLTAMWARMPALMLGKCAEAIALRRAYPAELAGVYEPAEIVHEEPTQPRQPERQPGLPGLPERGAEPMSDEQRKKLMALAGDHGLSREARLHLAGKLLGRSLDSYSELNREEAARLINWLTYRVPSSMPTPPISWIYQAARMTNSLLPDMEDHFKVASLEDLSEAQAREAAHLLHVKARQVGVTLPAIPQEQPGQAPPSRAEEPGHGG